MTLDNILRRKQTEPEEEQNEKKQMKDEVKKYFRSASAPEDKDPLTWWSEHEQDNPRLSKLARRLLATPGSNAGVERMFSDAGRLVTKARAALQADTTVDLLFLYENRHLIDTDAVVKEIMEADSADVVELSE